MLIYLDMASNRLLGEASRPLGSAPRYAHHAEGRTDIWLFTNSRPWSVAARSAEQVFKIQTAPYFSTLTVDFDVSGPVGHLPNLMDVLRVCIWVTYQLTAQ